MRPLRRAINFLADHARQKQHLGVPSLFVVLGTVSGVHGPVRLELLVGALSWAVVGVLAVFWAGIWRSNGIWERGVTSWAAGAFLALAQICERVACDREGIWTMKGLLPLFVVLASESRLLSKHFGLPSFHIAEERGSESTSSLELQAGTARSYRILAVATVSATVALATNYTTPTTSTLGFSSVTFTAAGLVLFESSLRTSRDESVARKGSMSAHGTVATSRNSPDTANAQQIATLRDVAFVMAVLCGVGSWLIEPRITPDAITWEPVYSQLPGDWKDMYYHRTVWRCIGMVFVNILANFLVFHVLSHQGAAHASFLAVFSCICARLHMAHSFSGIWFTIIFSLAAFLSIYNPSSTPSVDVRSSIRLRRILFGVTSISFASWLLRSISEAGYSPNATAEIPRHDFFTPPAAPLAPINMDLSQGHPALQLTTKAERKFQGVLSRQSKTLAEAVQEYRRRNGIAPPPHFDKWYEFATRNHVQLIDEFDTISDLLLPFWSLKSSTIRERVRLALGNEENALIGVMIRNGEVVKVSDKGDDWQKQATVGMMKQFIQYLPDMDLAFNIHDEPRVVVPNDQLSTMVQKAHNEVLPAAAKTKTSRNAFSPRAPDLGDGKRFEDITTSRFNRFAHQQTWTHARLSCPTTSQAWNYEESAPDNVTSYAAGPLNYIYNQTAFSDICSSPSFSTTFGFFQRPNAFNVIHELTPIFSQSKISSFQDILYPSPWYWYGKVGYDDDLDPTWESKTNALYWRGSTTGGFSRAGGWRTQHRQSIVKQINSLDKARVLVPASEPASDSSPTTYEVTDIDRPAFDALINVTFSHVGQCDPGDCDAQSEFFHIAEHAEAHEAWNFKHLLDMDGNAFSGRFYSFLRSRSLSYKMAVFREWHAEWLWPWVHYIPLSLQGNEHWDLVRWFAGEEGMALREEKGAETVGEKKAREMAERSRNWAGKALRNVDLEVWFFRLLLEYGRIVDDNREEIGYPGP